MKKLFIVIIWLVWLVTLAGCGNKETLTQLDVLQKELDVQVSKNVELVKELQEKVVVETWVVETWAIEVIETVVEEKTFLEKDPIIVASEQYPNQPQNYPGGYANNTAQLRAWARSHMWNVQIPDNARELHIKLAKPLQTVNGNIVIYVEWDNWYCGGRIRKDIYTDYYIFDLKEMLLVPDTCSGDWTKKINGQTIKVSGYVSTYDNNKITEISFK